MARCPKCGKEVTNETQKFCDGCGAPLQENLATGETPVVEETPVAPVPQTTSGFDFNAILEKVKSGDKKAIGIVVGAIAVVVVVVLLLGSLLFGGGNYMDPLNAYMKAMNSRNGEYLEVETVLSGDKLGKIQRDLMNAYLEVDAEYYYDYSFEDRIDDGTDYLDDFYDNADDEYEDWKITFEKKDAEKLDKDEREDMTESMNDSFSDYLDDLEDMLEDDDDLEAFADNYDIDEDEAETIIKEMIKYCKFFADGNVQDAYEVKGKFIIESEDGTLETDTVELRFVKINGSWIYFGSGDYIEFDDDDEWIFDMIESDLNYGSMTFGLF